MTGERKDDLIVVGAGVFGLGTALEAARRGYAVTVVDRGPIPHPAAASNGPSRKLRSTYLDTAYSRLVIEAATAWDEITAATGQVCFERLGNLVYTVNDVHPTLDAFQAASEGAGGRIERLDRADLRRRFPTFRLARAAIFEAEGGVLRATTATRAIGRLAEAAGARIDIGGPVVRIDRDGAQPAVALGDGRRLTAPRIVVAAGAWTTRLVPELRDLVTLKRQGLAYLPELPPTFDDTGFPPFSELETVFYGFPRLGNDPVKIGWHPHGEPTDDPDIDRDSAPQGFVDGVIGFFRDHLGLAVDETRMIKASCLYEMTATTDFIIDAVPGDPSILVATGSSGHGFKFGSIIGRVVMDRLEGTSGRWLPTMAWSYAVASASETTSSGRDSERGSISGAR
jgi:glycine/D-amino acid oxidase-like deaminating enzyme